MANNITPTNPVNATNSAGFQNSSIPFSINFPIVIFPAITFKTNNPSIYIRNEIQSKSSLRSMALKLFLHFDFI